MKSTESLLKIAEIHADRLRYAMSELKHKMPLSAQAIAHLSNKDVLIFELYASRFSKLQDFMGAVLFTAALQVSGEQADEMTFLDKLHKLEKLKLVVDASEWMRMRQVRNSLSHEYPDHPELTAAFFNQAYTLGPMLLECLDRIMRFLKQYTSKVR